MLTPSDLRCAQGELISESGTMTGGGGKPRRGKMQLGSGPPKGAVVAAAIGDGKETAALESDVQQLQQVRQLYDTMPHSHTNAAG